MEDQSLWTDKVIIAFVVLVLVVGWAINEIAKAEEAFDKFGEYQDNGPELDEWEKEISS